MAHSIASNELEQQHYMSYHEDGLLDLLIGLAVLPAGVYALVDLDIPLGALWLVLWLPVWLSAKKSITARRAPGVEVSQRQYVGMMRAAVFVVTALVLLVFAVLVVLWGRNAGFLTEGLLAALAQYLMVGLGLSGALILSVAAWLSGLARLYAYAVLTALAFVGGYLIGASFALALTVVAAVVSVWGAVLLVRFVKTHPIQQA